MEVFALIGASGTGKSHNAHAVLAQYKIDVMIDDGLLIKGGKKMAGTSAKAEATMVQAVKRAIFHDPLHAGEVRERIRQLQPKKILILGTSEKMIDRITVALELPGVSHKIFIQDIATPEQIAEALRMRKDGKHVIPLPSIEVKKDLPNYWIDSIFGFVTKKKGSKPAEEKSIVRPKFSQLGTLTISENAIEQIVTHLLSKYQAFASNARVQVQISNFGVSIYCDMKVHFGTAIQPTIAKFQKETIQMIDDLTSLTVLRIDVRITGIAL